MKYIGKVLGWGLMGVNLLISFLLLLSAFSPYINPLKHSILSCSGLAFPAFFFLNMLFLLFWLVCYKRYSFISIIAIVLSFPALRTYYPLNLFSEKPKGKSIKILSYNTMAFGKGEKDDNGKYPVLEYIKNSDADIVCVQEYIPGNGLTEKKINNILSSYPYKSFYSIASHTNGLGIFSRFPILSSKVIKYDSNANASVAYQLKIDGDTVVVINNHFESNKLTEDDKAIYKDMIIDPDKEKVKLGSKLLIGKLAQASRIRASQADSVAKFIASISGKTVIACGDFNDSPLSYTHNVMSRYLNDAFVNSGKGFGISYNKNGFYFRIDHIMVSPNLNTYQCTVDNSIKDSDHYPIWCYISKK